MRPGRRSVAARTRWFIAFCVCVLALPAIAGAEPVFPGTDPVESPRVNTPNDPKFDNCELDDESPDTPPPGPDCSSYAEEEFRAFGFSPDSANQIPPAGPHYLTGTRYTNCAQLDQQGRDANRLAEGLAANDPQAALAECLQIAGVRADTAWKYSTGDPATTIAILDTGIRWSTGDLLDKVDLNEGELPAPQNPAPGFDPDAYRVSDFAGEVGISAGDQESDLVLDGSDVIATFSDGADDDGNGYIDDIAGWDFFDDDNDPFDASSCCSASGHGTGRAREAAAATNNGQDGVGMCPDCQIMPLRVWDSFVVPTDNYAMGVVYAADNGAEVVEGAVGGLTNTRFARRAFSYADSQGLALMLVSSDINSANHNYPTHYNEAIYVAGALYDTAPNDTCSGPGGLPGLPDPPVDPTEPFAEGCQQFLGFLQQGSGCPEAPTCITSAIGQPLTTSFFRNSNLTQYGGKADIVLMGSTGSENTGQSSGAAGLLMSFGLEELGTPLSGNEVRQLLTMTAEDVLPENTGVIGLPDRAEAGWDSHFGYGRVNLAGAMARIANDRIPPEAQLDSPDWFAPINIARVPASGIPIRGRALAPHGAGVGSWEVEWACGQDALDAAFQPIPGAGGTGAVAPGGALGTIPRSLLESLADTCDGSVQNDPGRPAGTVAGAWPANPYPAPDPERHAFQIRLTVHEAGDPQNIGRYRKTLHAYRNDGNLTGWPRPVGTGSDPALYATGSGGETSPRLFDVDGDNALDVIQPTSSGEMYVLNADGTPVAAFNDGQPVTTDPYLFLHELPAGLPVPRESLRVPAIGDIDGDLEAEIVATAGEHLYAWELDGTRAFKVRLDPALSEPCKPGTADLPATGVCLDTADRALTEDNHLKRGFIGSPALADLSPGRPGLEIVAGALDQHLYAWDGSGALLPGFPLKLQTDGASGAEIITSPAIAELTGSAPPEIVIATNEVTTGDPAFPTSFFSFLNSVLAAGTGFNPVYAVRAAGTADTSDADDSDAYISGWPVEVGVAAGSLLPLVLPGHDAAIINTDGGTDEVAVSAATSVMPGGARLVDAAGDDVSVFESNGGNRADPSPILNLADYASAGDVLGMGVPQILKGGLTANGAANLLAVNQNLPFNHVEQLWTPAAPDGSYTDPGPSAPGFPLATDDFQLLSQAAVARVGSPTTPGARQALVGTGLYQLHAYGPGGEEPPGWPKFTGGWTQATPAVGDADGDGDLDVTTLTREGWSFLWDTGIDACTDSNAEWWTYHHDEHSTANYGHDGRPPGTPEGLSAVQRDNGGVRLRFTAPGDDWLCGKASKFRVLVRGSTINRPADGRAAGTFDSTGPAGETETLDLGPGSIGPATHIAVLHRDEAGNWGHLAQVRIRPAGGPGPGGLKPGACANRKRGTPRSQTLRGTRAGDRILGLAGRDSIFGLRARDCLLGGRGKDRLNGGRGRDRLKGGKGPDRVAGGAGPDRLLGGDGADRLFGGPGRDVVRTRGDIRDRIDCGPGRDIAVVDHKDRVRRCETVRRRRRR